VILSWDWGSGCHNTEIRRFTKNRNFFLSALVGKMFKMEALTQGRTSLLQQGSRRSRLGWQHCSVSTLTPTQPLPLLAGSGCWRDTQAGCHAWGRRVQRSWGRSLLHLHTLFVPYCDLPSFEEFPNLFLPDAAPDNWLVLSLLFQGLSKATIRSGFSLPVRWSPTMSTLPCALHCSYLVHL
jgi:hypothetical protein